MKLRRISLVLFLLGLGLVYPTPSALACSCVEPPADDVAVKQAAAVFTGTVTDSVGPFLGGGRNGYAFEVDRVYKGAVHSKQWIDTGSGGGDCGYEFRAGKRYVVFADSEDGESLYTSICTSTRRIGDDNELELAATGTLLPGRSRGSPPDIFLALLTVVVGLVAYAKGRNRSPG